MIFEEQNRKRNRNGGRGKVSYTPIEILRKVREVWLLCSVEPSRAHQCCVNREVSAYAYFSCLWNDQSCLGKKGSSKEIIIPDVRCYTKRSRRSMRTFPVEWGMQSGKKWPSHGMSMLERSLPGQDCSPSQLSPIPGDMYTYNWPWACRHLQGI